MKQFLHTHPVFLGTVILTASGIFCRVIGFLFRIFLSRILGAEGLGIYQLVFPVLNICFAFCCGGFSTAVSKSVAANKDRRFLHCGLLSSLLLAAIASGILWFAGDYIAESFLQDARCIPLLKLLAFSVPASALHSCLCGYYYGIKLPGLPAAAQILEQLARISATGLFYINKIQAGASFSPVDAILGVVLSEMVSAAFLLAYYLLFGRKKTTCRKSFSKALSPILQTALPLTGTRLMLSGLSGLEAVLIPVCLRASGLPHTRALELYGIITGMVMPFLMFPSALTNSAAVMLLPEVAEAKAKKEHRRIRRTASVNISFCSSLGVLCTLFFLIFGRFLGTFFYSNETAGSFLVMLSWLCPFLYLATTSGSILNGLGYTGSVFFHNILSALIRLSFLFFLTPVLGVKAWLWGMLAGEVLLTLLHLLRLVMALKRDDQDTTFTGFPERNP